MTKKQRASKSPEDQLIEEMERGKKPRQAPSDEPLRPRNDVQASYIAAIATNILTFGIGPAGTGKTFIAATMAADALAQKKVRHVIITRPMVEAGDSMGFLPGTAEEKFDPYFAPVRKVFERRLGAGFTEYLVKHGHLETLPLALMRGHTFEDSFVIFDEAQNSTITQMKMFLTRIGERCKVIVDGDPEQIDLPDSHGLQDAVERLRGVRGVSAVTFTDKDVVRSGIAQRIVQAYKQ